MNPLDSVMQGFQLGQGMADSKNKRTLAGLYQQTYNAPKDQRGAGIAGLLGMGDVQGATAMQKHFDAQDERQVQEVVRAARTLAVLPPEQQGAFYQQELPKFRAMGLTLPDQMDDSVRDSVTKIAQAWSGAEQKDNTPSDIRTLQMLRDNPELMALYERKARAGWQPQIKSADDGSLWGVDPATMSGQRMNLGGAPSLPMPQGAQGVQALYDDLLKPFPGTQVTSIVRSPEHNARVGGHPDSQHLPHRRTARDVVPPREQWDDVAAAARARGVQVIDEGDHLHFQQGRGSMAAAPSGGPTFGRKSNQPKPPSGYQWTPQGTLAPIAGGPAQVAIDARADAAAARKAAEDAKSDVKRRDDANRQRESVAAATNLVTAIDELTKSAGFDDLGTTWGDVQINTPLVRNDAKDAQAQLKNVAGQVALATMARLKALSSSGATGFGSMTAPELKLLENSIAALQAEDISNAQLRKSLKVIRDSMEKVAGWQPGAAQPAPASNDRRRALLDKY